MDFRTQVKDLFGTRIELRLGDPSDSELDRKVAVNVPKERPGRGLVVSKHHVLTALPRIDGDDSAATLGAGIEHLVQVVSQSWRGAPGPKLRLLPEQVTLDQVRAASPADTRELLLGIDEAALAPVGIDIREENHLYAFGDGGSGKSGLLRVVAAEVRRTHTPAQAQIFAVDFRRALLGEIPDEYLAGYLTTQDQATTELSDLAAYLRTPAARAGRHARPAPVALVVDRRRGVRARRRLRPRGHHHRQPGRGARPPARPGRRRRACTSILTRRTGGAARAMYEPVLQALRDLAVPGLVLSGSPDEGALIGGAKPVASVPGRGQLVTRDEGRRVVQLAWSPATV